VAPTAWQPSQLSHSRLADLDRNPRRHLIMQEVCHGGPTYPDGGCKSHRMLEDVARLKVRYPERFHFLLSNQAFDSTFRS
jgi:hypothetical protein